MKYGLKILQNIDNLITYLFSNHAKENKFLKKFFKQKKIVFFDVGTNLGSYTDFVLKNNNTKEVHLFEPSKECFKYLSNKYSQKKIIKNNKAVSSKKNIKTFYENEILSQSSLHNLKNKYNHNYNYIKKYKIKCISIDDYCNKINKKIFIDLLKIDAEGEDLNVLIGSKKMLKKKRIKLIKIELLNKINNVTKNSYFNDIIFFLNNYNYHLVSIVKTKFDNENLLMMDAYFCNKRL